MAETTLTGSLVRFADLQQQEAETYRYWRSCTTAERMAAIDEIVRDSYAAKGLISMFKDQADLLSVFYAHRVEYLVIGVNAVESTRSREEPRTLIS